MARLCLLFLTYRWIVATIRSSYIVLQSTASAASRCTATPNLCFFFILPPMPLQPEPFPDDPSLAELSQVMSWLLLLLQRDGRRRFCCLLPPPRRPTTAANAEAETGNQHLFAFAVEATNLSQFKIRRFNCMFIRPLIMCACLSPCTIETCSSPKLIC